MPYHRILKSGQSKSFLRPYHAEYTDSRPITKVKQRRARLVSTWNRLGTAGVVGFLFFFVVVALVRCFWSNLVSRASWDGSRD